MTSASGGVVGAELRENERKEPLGGEDWPPSPGSERNRATMGACSQNNVIAVRRRVLKPIELLRQLRSAPLPVAGLLMDVGGVLYDSSAWWRWLFQLVSRMGLRAHYTPFLREWRQEYLEQVKLGHVEHWAALRMFLCSAGLTNGQIDEIEASGHAKREELEGDIRPLPGVVNTLTYLVEHEIQLTVLCSSYLDLPTIQRRLTRLELSNCFHAVVSTADLAIRRSGIDCFGWAIGSTGYSPGRLGYVGCDTTVLGQATAAGLRTVAFNYEEDAAADVYIERFDMLPEALPFESVHRAAG